MIFYGKPQCISNKKQLSLLTEKGFIVEKKNILTHKWTKEVLQMFFKGTEVSEWVNPSAPAIKSGEVDILGLSEDDLLILMIKEPILIRRPLIVLKGESILGFDIEKISNLSGINIYEKNEAINETQKAFEACSNP